MRKVKIEAMGPLGYKDSADVFGEDELLLTAAGAVKPVRQLKEGDVLVRFNGNPGTPLRWTILRIEWMRRESHGTALHAANRGSVGMVL
jgi:hypothetical protein